jgi:sulfoxide reductase heme-binding subunit YedZ
VSRNADRRRLVHALIVALGFTPLAALVFAALTGGLSANPVEDATHRTGIWTLRFLIACLAVTPLRRVCGWSALAPYRRSFGLLSFFYASLHFAIYVCLDLFFAWDALLEDLGRRPYISVGFTGLALMLPLAATSTRGMMRRLGRQWMRLHRLVYVAALCGVLHFLWLVKVDLREPLIYAAILALLLAIRLAPRTAKWFRSLRRFHAA